MLVETHQDALSYTTKLRKITGGNIGAGGVIPHQITLLSPFSRMAGMDQMTKRLSCLYQWLVLQIHLMNPNSSTHGDVRWSWALQGYYPRS